MSDNLSSSLGLFNKHEIEPQKLSPVVLAFVGDAVYEILVRDYIVSTLKTPPQKVHSECVKIVKASAQAVAIKAITPLLSEEEYTIFKRGRNANTVHVPKNSSPADYRYATGLEALFGYLYLCDDINRINDLFNEITKLN